MKVYSITDIGQHRKINEDSYDNYLRENQYLLVVADGMGGHKAGEIASSITVKSIIEYFKENEEDYENPLDLINDAIYYANEKVYRESIDNSDYNNMGTTIVLAYILNDELFIANVGDSRAYLKNEYGFKQVSRDHSLVNDLLLNGTITEEEAELYTQRNIITRAMGIEENVEADSIVISLSNNDTVLLCTDGLTSELSDEEIEEVLTEDISLEDKCKKLVDLSNERGGKDNITITLYEHGEVNK
ncbi:MAG: Stp1/IreP family PP2C-type Ser/Thr phosphatase [Tissierellia bacterium]|nr:Stp1/IreP family PP2C-type Ser/Thr phosphatase [Tissierellia bacterium]